MKKSVLLKIQLAEAAKYAVKEELPYKRLAVIMLDNFMELQLSSLIRYKLSVESASFTKEERRQERIEIEKALKNYDDLLRLSKKRGFINEEEKYQLCFCHKIRNNLYHHAEEEFLLMEVALIILYEIIVRKQPLWKNGVMWYSCSSTDIDPFYEGDKMNLFLTRANTEEEWISFLEKHFVIFNDKSPNIQTLLSQSLLNKVNNIRENYAFIEPEFHLYFPWAKNWDFNDYVMHYAFQAKLKELPGGTDDLLCQDDRLEKIMKMHSDFISDWKRVSINRVDSIEKKAREMIKMQAFKALERYINMQPDLSQIYYSLKEAAKDLDESVQLAIDIARGK